MNQTPYTAGGPSGTYVRAAYVAVGLAALACVYALLPGVQTAFNVWVATLVALMLAWGYTLHIHHGRVPLRGDTMALAGFTLTHLLPPLYLSLRDGAEHVDVYRVGELQSRVALLTGVAAILLLVSFRAVYRRLGGNDEALPQPSPTMPAIEAVPVLVILAAVIGAARLYLLVSGAYYWTYSEESFVTGRWYSITSTLSRYGILLPITLWLLAWSDRRWRPWAIAAATAELAWVVPSGSRQALLEAILAFTLVAWWRNRRLPRGRMLGALLAACVVMPILGEYRYTIGLYTNTRDVSYGATVSALWEARERLGFEGTLEMTDRFVDRLYDAQFFAYLMKHYREAYDWEYGQTYTERLPYVAVPYFVTSERPIMQVPLDRWFRLMRAGSNPSTLLGEAYANFGYFGVLLIGGAAGVVIALYEALARRLRKKVIVDAMYLYQASMLPFMVTQSFVSWMSFFRNALLAMVAMLVLTRVAASLGRRPRMAAPPSSLVLPRGAR